MSNVKNARVLRVGARWHDERRRTLLASHPEARTLMGPNPVTAVLVVGLVALQVWLALLVREQPWYVVLTLAAVAGAFIAHALGVLIHDAAHDLVFRSRPANRVIAMVANLPLLFPAAMDFRFKHLQHHAHLGEPDGADTQAPQAWDFRFATTRARTFVWHLVGPILTHGDAPTQRPSAWVWVNVAVQVAVGLPFALSVGWRSVLYLALSGVLAFAHHPVGARRYGEHLTLREGQPTVSYYGPLNWLSFDVGLHVEHHDLPSVPWNRLRAINRLAPELYSPLASLSSWTRLLWQLISVPGEGPARYVLERRPLEPEDHPNDLPRPNAV